MASVTVPTLHCPSRPQDIHDLSRRLSEPDGDKKETTALRALVQTMLENFQDDSKLTYLAEAALLPAVLNGTQYRTLISAFCNAILESTSDNTILDPILLQSFAQTLRCRGTLSADNAGLGAVLDSLSTRLGRSGKTGNAEPVKQYQLVCLIGTVLDAMVDIKVTDIDHDELHKPLRERLSKLCDAREPRLAQAASYALGALRGVTHDQGPWTAFWKTSWRLITVVAAVTGGVAGNNPKMFTDAVPDVLDIFKIFKRLVQTGQELQYEDRLKEGFVDAMRGLQKPMLWYAALRYARVLIEAGAFVLLRQLVLTLPQFKGQFWIGLYAELERAWVSLEESKAEIEDFVEWLHCQDNYKVALDKDTRIPAWRNILASTFEKTSWEMSSDHSLRHRFFGKKGEDDSKTALPLFRLPSNITSTTSRNLLESAWQHCLETKQYYADCRLIQYYTEAERLFIRRLSGEQLDLDHCYTNLQIVESSKAPGTHRAGSEISLRQRLRVEHSAPQQEVQLQDLFAPRSNGRPRRILIRGRAGVGKTTLCKKIVHEFICGRIWTSDYDRIVWIPLRKLRGKSFEQFIENEYFATSEEKKLLTQALWRRMFGNSKRTLFLLDGFDEVVGERTVSGSFADDFKDLFDRHNVIMTSRPYASVASLASFDLELETIGFHPAQVQEYVARAMVEKAQAKEICDFIEGNDIIEGLLQIPVQLDALCYTWGEDLLATDAKSMTALYRAIEVKLWRKDMVQLAISDKAGPLDDSRAKSYRLRPQIERLMGDEVRLLEMLAFNGLAHNIVEFHAHHCDNLYMWYPEWNHSMLNRSSFLRSQEHIASRASSVHYFIHLTFQEYFAAAYFVRCWITNEPLLRFALGASEGTTLDTVDPKELIQKEKYNGRYNIMWRFTAGLLSAAGNDKKLVEFLETLEAEPRDLLGSVHLRLLMHCFYEIPLSTDKHSSLSRLQSGFERALFRLFCSGEIGKYGDVSVSITYETEFPEHLLERALKCGTLEAAELALGAFSCRNKVSYTVLETILFETAPVGRLEHLYKHGYSVLSRHHRSISDKIIELITSRDLSRRKEMIECLWPNTQLSASLISTLVVCLDDCELDIVESASRCLAHQTLAPAIFHQLAVDTRGWVREIALKSLAWPARSLDKIGPDIVNLLQDEEALISKETATSLAHFAAGRLSILPPFLIDALASYAKDAKWDTDGRLDVLKSLRDLQTTTSAALSILESMVTDEDAGVMKLAVDAYCAHAGISEGMRRELENRCEDSRYMKPAVKALCKYSDYEAELLRSLMAEPMDGQQVSGPRHAVFALRDNTELPQSILRAILVHVSDQSADVRKNAARCIGAQSCLLGDLSESLLSLLECSSPEVYTGALKGLGSHPRLLDSRLVSAIRQHFKDPNARIKGMVVGALSKHFHQPGFFADVTRSLKLDSYKYHDFLIESIERVLREQPFLPLDTLKVLVQGFAQVPKFGYSCFNVLLNQGALPPPIISPLTLAVAKIGEPATREWLWIMLLKHQNFFTTLPDLPAGVLVAIFTDWLRWPNPHFCCYFWNDAMYIDRLERLWEVDLKDPDKKEKVMSAYREAKDRYPGLVMPDSFRLVDG